MHLFFASMQLWTNRAIARRAMAGRYLALLPLAAFGCARLLAQESCALPKPQNPAYGSESAAATRLNAQLIGFPEYASPSTPPKKYRRQEISGTMHWGRWGIACSSLNYPDSYNKSGSGISIPGIPFAINFQASLTRGATQPDGRIAYTAAVSGTVNGEPAGFRIVASDSHIGGVAWNDGETKLLDPTSAPWTVSTQLGYVFWQTMPDSTAQILNPLLLQHRDEWSRIQEVLATDYTGAAFSTNTNASVRYRGSIDGFPLASGGANIGPPNTGDYASLAATTLFSARKEITGDGQCVPFTNPIGSGKAAGTYLEELGVEDKEDDAKARVKAQLEKSPAQRAVGAVLEVASATAYHTTRGNGFTFGAQRATYRAGFDIKCPGPAEFVVHYTVAPRANPSAVAQRSVSFTKRLPAGRADIAIVASPAGWEDAFASLPKGDFALTVPDADSDYTLTKVELIQPCGRGGDGGESLHALGSVRSHFTLGRGPGGDSAGVIRLEAPAVSAALYSPAALLLSAPNNGGVAEVRDAAGTLRQVKAPQVFADIVTLSASAYEIRFHGAADAGAFDPVTGLYPVGGAPFAVHKVEDAAPASSGAALRLTETRGGLTKVVEYSTDPATGVLTLSTGNGLRRESMVETVAGDTRTTVSTIRNPDDTVAAKTTRTYRTFPGGREEQTSEILDPDGAALTTTWQYDSVGRLLSVARPDGGWEKYSHHDSLGRPTRVLRPFGHRSLAQADEGVDHYTSTVYGGLGDQDGDGLAEVFTINTDHVEGGRRGYRWTVEYTKPVLLAGEPFARRADLVSIGGDDSLFSASNLVTETLSYGPGPFNGRPRRVVNPDGTVTLTTYALDAAGQQTMVELSGAPNAAKDGIVDGTRLTTFTNAQGHAVGSATVDIASGLTLGSWTATSFDALGRPTRMDHADGTYETRDYACCGLASARDRAGGVTAFEYDALGRPTHVTRDGLVTRTAYDAAGRAKTVTRVGADNSEIVQQTNTYDPAGRLVETRDALNRPTTILEVFDPVPTVARRVTTTNPDGGTRIESYQRDGTLLTVAGTAAAPLSYVYTGDSTREIRLGSAGETTEWTRTTYDHAGRPRFTDALHRTNYFYNNLGQLVRETDPEGLSTLRAYNAKGEQTVTALDLDGNGLIDYAGTDRLTRTTTAVAQKTDATGTYTVQRTTTEVWETDGQDTPTVVSIGETTPDGLRSWQTVRGLTTSTVVTPDGAGGRTVVTTAPDGTVSTKVYANGRLASQTTSHPSLGHLAGATFVYDPHGRLQTSTDARNGTTTYAYFADDQIHTVTTPDPDPTRSGDGYDAQTTTFGYDAAGRQNTVTQPDGGVVTTEYFPTGQVKKTSGARTYPVEYTYDSQQRVKTLKTWQNFANATGAAVTTWNYDSTRGLLQNKRYTDNTGPNYSYTFAGRLRTRTWARGITTTYSYNTAGDLTTIDYSDTTPDVSIQYDRAGRPKSRTDAAGQCVWTYEANGQLDTETYTGGLLGGMSIDRSFDSLARLSGLVATGDPALSYQYDAASRLEAVTQGAHSASYTYLPNSPLVGSVTFRNGANTRLLTTKAYDRLDRLTSITNTNTTAFSRSLAYEHNAANQRTKATRENGAYWEYGYDSLGQVTSGRKYLPAATPVNGFDFAWSFDDIGNRKTATANGQTSNYTPNLLNQYSNRTVPGVVDILGEAQPDATVTLQVDAGPPQAVVRQGDLYSKQIVVDNATAAQNPAIKVTGVKNLVGPAGEDAVTEITRRAFTPKTPETFTYDADGNQLTDAAWVYTWDGENRLKTVETSTAAAAAGAPRKRIEYDYDGQSRRVAKRTFSWNGTAWVPAISTRFLHDNWNLLAEYDALAANAVIRSYAWGLDLSGSLQGAGGVGGLLFTTLQLSTSTSRLASAFDGNGNVLAYVDLATGTESASFDYGAFGEPLVAAGSIVDNAPFRFSTRYHDDDAELILYPRRPYTWQRGQWLSRDPIEERGAPNLYNFVSNSTISKIDPLGFKSITLNVSYDNTYKGNFVKDAERFRKDLDGILKRCCKEFSKGCGVTVVMNRSNVVLLPRPKAGYITNKDLKDVAKYLDAAQGIPLILTNEVQPGNPDVQGVGRPEGLVIGTGAPRETFPHEMGHVANAEYPFLADGKTPNPNPKHNPDSNYLMYYTTNSGKLDCEYCTKLEALAK
jgi:RHS repeat-associated protein